MLYETYQRLGVSVAALSREVIKAASKMLNAKGLSREWRNDRHEIYRTLLKHHRDAQKLYMRVMSGRAA